MAKTYRNLYPQVVAWDNLYAAYRKARKGKRGKVPFAIRFHLGRHVEATLSEGGKGASLLLSDGSLWQFVSGEPDLQIEESLWVDGNGRPHPVQQLVIQGMASRGGGNFAWLLKRMG